MLRGLIPATTITSEWCDMKVIRLADFRDYKIEKNRARLGDLHYRNFQTWLEWKRTGTVRCNRLIIWDADTQSDRNT
jgi:hypothetical protein